MLSVSGVPGLQEKRQALLPLAHKFASTLSEEVKKEYEHPASFYSFGWSHGKEKLQGRPDVLKGSYYANPMYDAPSTDAALIQKYPAFLHPNIWPQKHLPELEPAFKDLGRLIVHVGALVARHCDAFVRSRCPTYPRDRLERIVRESRVCKGRLLHYFPYPSTTKEQGEKSTSTAENHTDNNHQEKADADVTTAKDFSTWCGWHNDHGSLTGLTPAMYLDQNGHEVSVHDLKQTNSGEDENEDEGGLYALSRAGEVVKVLIQPNHLAFQIGETAQIHSGGILRATPHAVKGSSSTSSHTTQAQGGGISRETFAVFMEPEMGEPMTVPAGRTKEETCAHQYLGSEGKGKGVKVKVPLLESRWEPRMDFAAFTERTLNAYY